VFFDKAKYKQDRTKIQELLGNTKVKGEEEVVKSSLTQLADLQNSGRNGSS